MNVFKTNVSIVCRALKVIEEMMPGYLFYMILRAIVCSISPFVSLYLSGRIVDAIVNGDNIEKIVLYVLFLISFAFLFEMLNQFLWGKIRVNQLIFDSWEEYYLNKKGFNLDFKQIEDPKIRALRQKIIDNRNFGGLNRLILSLMFLLNNIFTVIISLLMLPRLLSASVNTSINMIKFVNSQYAAILFMFIIIVVLFVTVVLTKNGEKLRVRNSTEISEVQKYSNYYIDEYLDDVKVGKDIRLYSQKNLIIATFSTMIDKFSKIISVTQKEYWLYHGINDIIISVMNGCAYLYIGIKAISGAIGTGSIIEFSGIITRFIKSMSWITAGITELFINNEYIETFFDFVDLNSEMKSGNSEPPTNIKEISFENVSFTYPNSKESVLKNINLKLFRGEKIAIVGMNGSGKTTFIKLLCRLYDTTSGEIKIDSKNITMIDYEKYLSLFSVVFQDFKLFSFSIANNISASDSFKESDVWKVLDKTNFSKNIKQMSNTIYTNVYRDFDVSGYELSGGEEQKIAIARALYKDAPIMIFDEPTSSLDPIAESEIYEMINSATKDKTTLFISHRLSSCKFCDRIIVFDNGRIVQQGTHNELLEDVTGKYYQLWTAQSKYYIEKLE